MVDIVEDLDRALKPGKGCHAVLNQGVLDFLEGAVAEIKEVYSDQQHDADAKAILQALQQRPGWHAESDNFGKKAILATTYPDGEFRVTVVLVEKRGQQELKLDLRPWIEY